MKLKKIGTDDASLSASAALLKCAFPHASHLSLPYLRWLYRENPAGPAVGFNAWEENQVIGHYACIPVELYLDGRPCKGLLALNTAMHPQYRNAGIIYSLAKKTCDLAAAQGFHCIYAVANAASTPIFTKALRFQFIGQLTAALGFGRLTPDWEKALDGNRFRRKWTAPNAQWRAQNPVNPSGLRPAHAHSTTFTAKTPYPFISAYGIMHTDCEIPTSNNATHLGLKLYLGLLPSDSCNYYGYMNIPERLKPSPLNMIYRPLSEEAPPQLDRDEVILGFQDFDPY